MSKSKPRVYVNRFTGDIKIATKSQAKNLSEDYSRTEQIVNEHGERGMRMQLAGATVDILESKIVEVANDVKPDSK